jgi:hypothetical protein
MLRVPMPNREPASFIRPDEVALGSRSLRTGQQISMIVADEVFPRMGRYAIEAAVERLGQEVVSRHQTDIQAAVHGYILNREWAEPFIKQVISDTVSRILEDMLSGEPAGGEKP